MHKIQNISKAEEALQLASKDMIAFGKLTGTPTVNKGAVTMKTISKTNITSTMGVTLILETGRSFFLI